MDNLQAIENYIAAEMQRKRIPGLSLAVVTDGRTVIKKHYGLANVELGGRDYAHPRAAAMVELVALAGEEYEKVSPDDVTPAYLRKPDAEANWIERGGVKGGERG